MKQSVAEFLHLMYRGINLVLSTKQGGVIYHWTRLFFNINVIKATLEKKKKNLVSLPPGVVVARRISSTTSCLNVYALRTLQPLSHWHCTMGAQLLNTDV